MNKNYYLRDLVKTLSYIIIGLIFTSIFLFCLNYFQYYVHEMGHANVAILSSFAQKSPNLILNFNYVDFPLMKLLKVPQQTGATILKSYTLLFNLAGVFATIIFYALLFYLLAKIKIIKNNKILEISLVISFLILIIQDVAFNLFCGTDGLKLSCSEFTLSLLSMIFNVFLFISLGFFFAILIIFIKNKKLAKVNKTQKVKK